MPKKGYKQTAEHRAKLSAAHRGLTHTDETRAKMSRANSGYKHSEEARAKMSAWHRGKSLSPEHCAKLSVALKGRVLSPKQRAARVGRRHSPATRAKISASIIAHIKDCDGTCGRVACTPPPSPTQIENILVEVLLAEFPIVKQEVRFGRYRVDAYLPPPYHIAFEADGAYWHRDPEKDARRDSYLLAEHSLPVVRLTEMELKTIEGRA